MPIIPGVNIHTDSPHGTVECFKKIWVPQLRFLRFQIFEFKVTYKKFEKGWRQFDSLTEENIFCKKQTKNSIVTYVCQVAWMKYKTSGAQTCFLPISRVFDPEPLHNLLSVLKFICVAYFSDIAVQSALLDKNILPEWSCPPSTFFKLDKFLSNVCWFVEQKFSFVLLSF